MVSLTGAQMLTVAVMVGMLAAYAVYTILTRGC